MGEQKKRRRKFKLTKKALIEALWANMGNVSATAKSLGVTRAAVQYWLNNDEDVARARDDALGGMVDVANAIILNRLYSSNEDEAFQAAKFVVQTYAPLIHNNPLKRAADALENGVTIKVVFDANEYLED